jgi:hypothetical protein
VHEPGLRLELKVNGILMPFQWVDANTKVGAGHLFTAGDQTPLRKSAPLATSNRHHVTPLDLARNPE